jgi:uncharacterized protein YvpB
MATAAKFVQLIQIFLAYLVPLDVDVTGNIIAKLCEVWSETKKFCNLGYHGNGCHFEFVQSPKSCHTLRWIYLQSLMKFDERNKKKIFNSSFLVSMATAAKFVQPIMIFLADLIPLDVDVVSIKFHQFLFGE